MNECEDVNVIENLEDTKEEEKELNDEKLQELLDDDDEVDLHLEDDGWRWIYDA